jgi:hypothetical protein
VLVVPLERLAKCYLEAQLDKRRVDSEVTSPCCTWTVGRVPMRVNKQSPGFAGGVHAVEKDMDVRESGRS